MAYLENESLVGTKDGVNKTFTTVSNAIEIDNVYFKNTQLTDYSFVTPNTITLLVAPGTVDPLTASYWTTGSLINAGAPYEIPTKLEDLLFKVRSIIGELYTEEWHDRMLTDWMNEALNVICTKADFPFMEAEATVYTVVGQDAYQLPAGFKKIIKVHTGATETQKSDDRESISSSYTLFNDTIIIPAPATAYEFKIRYYRYLPYFDWTNINSTCKLPRQYEDMLIDYAVMRAKQQEELYDVANIHMNMFTRRFDDMVMDLKRRIDADYPSIRPLVNLY